MKQVRGELRERGEQEEQLDLFGALMGDPCSQPAGTGDPVVGYHRPTTGYAACPVCVGRNTLMDAEVLQFRNPPIFESRDSRCPRCYGAGCIEVPVRVADGFWWDARNRRVIKAGDEKRARRKAGNGTVAPLVVECGGYR